VNPAAPAAADSTLIGTAASVPAKAETAKKVAKKARRTRLEVAKPHAGDTYKARMSFGRVPVATSALGIGCRARLSGKSLAGDGAIAGHLATCTWKIPADAKGERLVVTVKVSGRHGVSLVRRAKLIVGE
jgi:hypothetical protein